MNCTPIAPELTMEAVPSMRALELKIPPVVIGLLLVVAMWLAARLAPFGEFNLPAGRVIAAGLMLAGIFATFIAPEPVQTNSMSCGLTMGEATATPSDSTNHASTRRASWRAWRSACMICIIAKGDSARADGLRA